MAKRLTTLSESLTPQIRSGQRSKHRSKSQLPSSVSGCSKRFFHTEDSSVDLIFRFNTDDYADSELGCFPEKTRRYLAEALGVTVPGGNFIDTGGASDF